MEFDYGARVEKLRKKMRGSGVDAVITGGADGVGANSVYFGEKGFPAIIVFLPRASVLYSGGGENPLFDETIAYKKFREHFPGLVGKEKIKTIGVDEKSDIASILFWLRKKKIEAKPFGKKLDEIREVKEYGELRLIRKAAALSAELVDSVEPFTKTEHQVAGEMERAARRRGFALDAFPPIVASGTNSATPHAVTSVKKISPTDSVVVDAGARVEWYCGDCSRTFYRGREKEVVDAMDAVREAKKAAEKKAKPGVHGKQLASAALEVIKEYGFGDYSFRTAGLSVGHQIGLRVHEGRPLERVRLWKGMAFTIEPGIYVPKKFGTRFEDVVTI